MKKIKKKKKKIIQKVKTLSKSITLKKIKNKKSKIKVKKNKKVRKLKKYKIIKKKFKPKKAKVRVKIKLKAKKNNRISSKTRQVILGVIRLQDRITPNFKFNFSLDRFILSFFQSISVAIDNFKSVLAEERERKKKL